MEDSFDENAGLSDVFRFRSFHHTSRLSIFPEPLRHIRIAKLNGLLETLISQSPSLRDNPRMPSFSGGGCYEQWHSAGGGFHRLEHPKF